MDLRMKEVTNSLHYGKGERTARVGSELLAFRIKVPKERVQEIYEALKSLLKKKVEEVRTDESKSN